MMNAASDLVVARHLSQLLLAAANRSRDEFAEIAEEIGVPVQLARALCVLEDSAPMTELAAKLDCDKSYITPLADQLEAMGLINRVPGNDRRTKLLTLTTRGKSVRDAMEEQIAKRSPVVASLDESDRVELERILTKLVPHESRASSQ